MVKWKLTREDLRVIAQAITEISTRKFDPREPRDEEGKWTDGPGGIGGGASLSEDQAADSVATTALAWAALGGESNPPSHEQVAANWKKQLKGKLSDDAEAHAAVTAAQRENDTNSLWQRVIERFAADNVLVVKPPKKPGHVDSLVDIDASGQRLGGTTMMREDQVKEIAADVRQDVRDADAAASSGWGLAAVLRHEYGHSIDDWLDGATRRRLREALPDPGTDLTYYAGIRQQELVPELLALITHPDYHPEDWPETVQQAASILMEVIDLPKPKKNLSPDDLHRIAQALKTPRKESG